MAKLIPDNHQLLILVACNDDSLKAFNPITRQKHMPGNDLDTCALITCKDGKVQKQELYYGSSNLSQSLMVLCIPKKVSAVSIYDYQGKNRKVVLQIYAGK
jgi:hypothetical protein